jgi:hypothetical protein
MTERPTSGVPLERADAESEVGASDLAFCAGALMNSPTRNGQAIAGTIPPKFIGRTM